MKRAVPDTGRRRAINSRITDDIRSGLEAAAEKSGRTLSLEIETRLQDSITQDAADGHESAQLGRFIVAALAIAERRIGRPWHTDKASASYCFDRLKAALAEAMAVAVEMPDNKLQQAAEPDVTAARVLAWSDNHAAAEGASPLADNARAPWEPAFRPATPDELAAMVPARGQLPSSIGDRALFDEIMGPPRRDDGGEPADAPKPAPKRRAAKAAT